MLAIEVDSSIVVFLVIGQRNPEVTEFESVDVKVSHQCWKRVVIDLKKIIVILVRMTKTSEFLVFVANVQPHNRNYCINSKWYILGESKAAFAFAPKPSDSSTIRAIHFYSFKI